MPNFLSVRYVILSTTGSFVKLFLKTTVFTFKKCDGDDQKVWLRCRAAPAPQSCVNRLVWCSTVVFRNCGCRYHSFVGMLRPAGTQVTATPLTIDDCLTLLSIFFFMCLGSDWALSEAKHNLVTKYLGVLSMMTLFSSLFLPWSCARGAVYCTVYSGCCYKNSLCIFFALYLHVLKLLQRENYNLNCERYFY